MRRLAALSALLVGLAVFAGVVFAQGGLSAYLPLAVKFAAEVSTPTETATAIPEATSTDLPGTTATATSTLPAHETATTEPTATEPAGMADVVIVTISYSGSGSTEPDEYVEIRNDGSAAAQLSGWTLSDIANHVFTFPSFLMAPGQACRVYTNQYHPESCGFTYGSDSAIWNNSGDCAYLRDSDGNLVDDYCY
jgi:hypothetical protein